MSENEEMSMAQKLEVLRQVTTYGVGSGYEPNGERGPVVIEVPEFAPARSTITEIHSGPPVSSAEFDEPIIGGGGADPSHPWKVTSNGDNTVNIAEGKILWWDLTEYSGDDSNLILPGYLRTLPVAAAEVTVTGAGKIYLTVPVTRRQITMDIGAIVGSSATWHLIPDTATLSFSASEPATGFALIVAIADVSLSSGEAVVTAQHIRADIPLSIQSAYWGS